MSDGSVVRRSCKSSRGRNLKWCGLRFILGTACVVIGSSTSLTESCESTQLAVVILLNNNCSSNIRGVAFCTCYESIQLQVDAKATTVGHCHQSQ